MSSKKDMKKIKNRKARQAFKNAMDFFSHFSNKFRHSKWGGGISRKVIKERIKDDSDSI